MKFGVFDHIDEGGLAVGRQFEERLALIERYEHAGFHAYHLAEHHGTPLGHGPSPSVFIAAATQRTTTLRLGPLVYCLPLYHPLRLIEEVCMLDHLSDGRLQLGVGAGVSPIEVGFFERRLGQPARALRRDLRDPAQGPRLRRADPPRARARLRRACRCRCARSSGRIRRCGSGSRTPARADWAAEHEVNVVALLPAGMVRPITDAYRAAWEARGRAPEDIPFMGVSRLIVVAETDDEAMGVARRAYRRWFESINLLWRKYDVPSPLDGVLPEDFADWHAAGAGFAGTPAKAIEYVAAQEEEAGINYFCADLIFGDITFEEASRTVELFESEIIPAFDPVAAK